jgi:hypothetical protein
MNLSHTKIPIETRGVEVKTTRMVSSITYFTFHHPKNEEREKNEIKATAEAVARAAMEERDKQRNGKTKTGLMGRMPARTGRHRCRKQNFLALFR